MARIQAVNQQWPGEELIDLALVDDDHRVGYPAIPV
jgi:hypothetical protein